MDKLIIGCGYLGRRVGALWRAQGHRVFATARKAEHLDELARLGFEPIRCDVLEPAGLLLPAAATVLYCVGLDRGAGQSMRAVYVDGLANVLAHWKPPERLIYISSTSVYGQTSGEVVDESAATEPVEESGKIVLEAERLVRGWSQPLRPPKGGQGGVIILRFAGIYGPGRLLRGQAIRTGEPIVADGDRWVNLIHADDGARAVLAAEERGQPDQVYNVCDGQPVRRREFFTLLAQLMGAPEPRFVPPPPGTAAPHELANRRISNQRLIQELAVSLRYPSFREGLRASVGWDSSSCQ